MVADGRPAGVAVEVAEEEAGRLVAAVGKRRAAVAEAGKPAAGKKAEPEVEEVVGKPAVVVAAEVVAGKQAAPEERTLAEEEAGKPVAVAGMPAASVAKEPERRPVAERSRSLALVAVVAEGVLVGSLPVEELPELVGPGGGRRKG